MKRVAILMYHQVESGMPATRMCCPADRFRAQMAWLRQSGRSVVPLRDVVSGALGEVNVSDGAVAITFDDGYAAFCDDALPVLAEFGLPATMFAVAGKLGGQNDWVDNMRDRRALMSMDQLRDLGRHRVEVGSHSFRHPRLPEVDDAVLASELGDSRKVLQDILGQTVDFLAYPYGAYDARVRTTAQDAGYRGACSTRSGFNGSGEDLFALRRLDICGTDSLHAFKRKLDLGVSEWSLADDLRYFAGRVRRKFAPGASRTAGGRS